MWPLDLVTLNDTVSNSDTQFQNNITNGHLHLLVIFLKKISSLTITDNLLAIVDGLRRIKGTGENGKNKFDQRILRYNEKINIRQMTKRFLLR